MEGSPHLERKGSNIVYSAEEGSLGGREGGAVEDLIREGKERETGSVPARGVCTKRGARKKKKRRGKKERSAAKKTKQTNLPQCGEVRGNCFSSRHFSLALGVANHRLTKLKGRTGLGGGKKGETDTPLIFNRGTSSCRQRLT